MNGNNVATIYGTISASPSIIGDVTTKASVNGSVVANASLTGELSSNCVLAGVEVGQIVVQHSDYPDYDGSYDVLPGASEQTLDTTNKTLRENVTVKPIPYYDVANQYGRTIYIGGDLNA